MSEILDMIYAKERETFSKYAFFSENTQGRDFPAEKCATRTEFQRDRDKIIHSKSFRRLMHKTQVFLAPEDDHYRTRLTHTLEVSQIARTIARALRLNEDLTEAIALGHDLGHTPFGHAGERVLQQCYSPDFTHYGQSLRVVEKLENEGSGLNLTVEVRDGIVNHTGENLSKTLEGRIVKFADRIAYINHDIDDAVRAKVIKTSDIPKNLCEILGETHSKRIDCMVKSVISQSNDKNQIEMQPEIYEATMALRDFLFERVYHNKKLKNENDKAQDLLLKLYEYFIKHPKKLPDEFDTDDAIERRVADYIAGMTDRYAINLFESLFIPKVWRIAGEDIL